MYDGGYDGKKGGGNPYTFGYTNKTKGKNDGGGQGAGKGWWMKDAYVNDGGKGKWSWNTVWNQVCKWCKKDNHTSDNCRWKPGGAWAATQAGTGNSNNDGNKNNNAQPTAPKPPNAKATSAVDNTVNASNQPPVVQGTPLERAVIAYLNHKAKAGVALVHECVARIVGNNNGTDENGDEIPPLVDSDNDDDDDPTPPSAMGAAEEGRRNASEIASTVFIADTGASRCVIGEPRPKGKPYKLQKGYTIDTAGGERKVNIGTNVEVPGVGKRTALHLVGSPNLVSIGELIEEGWRFLWDNAQEAELMNPNGDIIRCPIQNRVPIIQAGAIEQDIPVEGNGSSSSSGLNQAQLEHTLQLALDSDESNSNPDVSNATGSSGRDRQCSECGVSFRPPANPPRCSLCVRVFCSMMCLLQHATICESVITENWTNIEPLFDDAFEQLGAAMGHIAAPATSSSSSSSQGGNPDPTNWSGPINPKPVDLESYASWRRTDLNVTNLVATNTGGPEMKHVKYRSIYDLKTKQPIVLFEDMSRAPPGGTYRRLPKRTDTLTTLYYDKSSYRKLPRDDTRSNALMNEPNIDKYHLSTPSFEHSKSHKPQRADCEHCIYSKLHRTPAKRSKEPTFELFYGDKIHCDMIGKISPPDYRKNVFILSTRDDATRHAKALPQRSKTDDETDLSWRILYGHEKVKSYRPDAGTEFRGTFERTREKEKLFRHPVLPRRSTYHSREERWHRELEEGTRASLSQGGGPTTIWSLAMQMWLTNENARERNMTLTLKKDDGSLENYVKWTSPLQEKVGHKVDTSGLVPFGTAAFYLNDTVTSGQKFHQRGIMGAIVGYGQKTSHGQIYKVVDPQKIKSTGKINIVHTRDVKIIRDRYPMVEEGLHANFKCSFVNDEEAGEKCETCRKFLVDGEEIPLCDGCRFNLPDLEAHNNDSSCMKNWCSCHTIANPEDADYVDQPDEPFEAVIRAPRRRRRIKSPRADPNQQQQQPELPEGGEVGAEENDDGYVTPPEGNPVDPPGDAQPGGEFRVERPAHLPEPLPEGIEGPGGALQRIGGHIAGRIGEAAQDLAREAVREVVRGVMNPPGQVPPVPEVPAPLPSINSVEMAMSMVTEEIVDDIASDLFNSTQEVNNTIDDEDPNYDEFPKGPLEEEAWLQKRDHEKFRKQRGTQIENLTDEFNNTYEFEIFDEDDEASMEKLFGLVTRVVPNNSPELSSKRAMEAMQKEMDNLDNEKVFGYLLEERDEVFANDPQALEVTLRMLCSEKFYELMLPEEEKMYKGRLIAQGCFTKDSKGRLFKDQVYNEAPITMAQARTLLALGLVEADPAFYHGDVRGAYVTTALRGRKIYGKVPRHLWFKRWIEQDKKNPLRNPVVHILKAIYGLYRANKDWTDKRHGRMHDGNWSRVTGNIWRKTYKVAPNTTKLVYSGIYVDDALVSGDRQIGKQAYKELHSLLGFSNPNPQLLQVYLGIETSPIKKHFLDGVQYNSVFLTQTNLTKVILQKYKAQANFKKLRHVSTPTIPKSEMVKAPDDLLTGVFSGTSSQYTGSLLYLVRGTRLDLAFATGVMGRHVSKWNKEDDRRLHRVMCYLEGTIGHGLVIIMKVGDTTNLDLELFLDADHAGDLLTRKSTSGAVAGFYSSGNLATLDYFSKLQSGTAGSTPEAEYVATCLSMKRIGLPLQIVIEDTIYPNTVILIVRVDNEAAERISETGHSDQLYYLKKHQGIAISMAKDMLSMTHRDRRVRPVDSGDNFGDIFTKGLEPRDHNRFSQSLGLVSAQAYAWMFKGGEADGFILAVLHRARPFEGRNSRTYMAPCLFK